MPRVALHGAEEVGLPQPLTPSEASQVRQILALQASGAFAEAERQADSLDLPWMLGAILADRYLNPAYRANPVELSLWLTHYGDQPQAAAIRAALQRLTLRPAASPTPAAAPRVVASWRIRSLFVQNRDEAVIRAATPLLQAPAGPHASDTLFIAGLAAWRQAQPAAAQTFFAASYTVADAPDVRAAAAFWSAHTAERVQNRGEWVVWLRRAALEGKTFYGHLARRMLDPTPPCSSGATLGGADLDVLVATPQGRRAFALLQVGERVGAEAELRALWQDTRPQSDYARALVLAARAIGLNQLARDVESDGLTQDQDDRRPLPRLHPDGGFLVDPPLVYALVRHESNFQANAVSPVGARGLMQIMPNTADWIAAGQARRLHDPAVNLAVGQRYLMLLAGDSAIDGNLLRLLAAYAQGPAAMKRWVDSVHDRGDPLMFLEAIPSPFIATYVRSALLTAWTYAAALHLPATSLDALKTSSYPHLVQASHLGDVAECRQPELTMR